MHFRRVFYLSALFCLSVFAVFSQQTNPVDRRVANPITDTPNINPITQEQTAVPGQKKPSVTPEGGDGEVVVYSGQQTVEGEPGKRVVVHTGNVDVRFGI